MATTIPQEFPGPFDLTPERIETIREWYVGALGDSDKASDTDDACYWQGMADAMSDVLGLLSGTQ